MLTRSLSKLVLCSPDSAKPIFCNENSFHDSKASVNRNYLVSIPDEVLFNIFSYLPLSDIGLLCITGSSLLTDRVVVWMNSSLCAKKICMNLTRDLACSQAEYYGAWVNACKEFGLLCKRVTMLHNSGNRLRLLGSLYSRVEARFCPNSLSNDWIKVLSSVGLAAAASTFILGWDEPEYNRVMEWVRGKLEAGSIRGLRIYFWEFIDHEDTKASLLSHILYTLAMSSQATSQVSEVLYLLLGPSPETFRPTLTIFQQNTVNRLQVVPDKFMMREQVPTTYEEAKHMFTDLGSGLRLLLRSSSISRKTLAAVIFAMFEDTHWNIDNRAACLLFSCETVVKMFLSLLSKKKDGISKVSHMLVSMVTVCGRLSNELSGGLFQILQWTFIFFEKSERKKLIVEFWKEIGERLEEGDVTEEILIQLGVLVGEKAYRSGASFSKKGLNMTGHSEE